MASGFFEDENHIRFVLIDSESMKQLSNLIIDKKVKCGTRHIRFLEFNNRVFVVASRQFRFVDIVEIAKDRLSTDLLLNSSVDVDDGQNSSISTISEHPSQTNSFLVAGQELSIKTVSLELADL